MTMRIASAARPATPPANSPHRLPAGPVKVVTVVRGPSSAHAAALAIAALPMLMRGVVAALSAPVLARAVPGRPQLAP